MVNFSVDQLSEMMTKPSNIRNISVIAHVDHGKSTLTDTLIAKGGIIANGRPGGSRFLYTRDDEQARSITIKSACVSLYFERQKKTKKKPYLINLVNSPGHLDFSPEVTAALRVTDGALVVVDCIEGVCVQTETVLRQGIAERIKPILFVNKLDRVFLEHQYDLEDIYQNLQNSVDSVNVIVATYKHKKMGDCELSPDRGNVGFGSGLHGWGFTLADFVKVYSSKFGLSEGKLMQKFWGNNWWDNKNEKWVKKNYGNKKLVRGFCEFVLKPLRTLVRAIMNKKKKLYRRVFEVLKIPVTKYDLTLRRRALLDAALGKWIPVADSLFSMIVDYLPSPVVAQRYRCETLYTGPMDDKTAQSIRKCNSRARLSMYVSKMVPTSELGRFIAFGRVFAGKAKTGQTVRILGPDYVHGEKKDLYVKKIQRTLLMMGRSTKQVSHIPAGNMVGLMGIDQYLRTSGTITTSQSAYPFKSMKFSVAGVVRVAIEPKRAEDLPKLLVGLRRLSKCDPLVNCSRAKTGEHVMTGAGELHLEICLKDLREEYLNGAEIKVSEPIVSYAETVIDTTGSDGTLPTICESNSPNKQNRLFVHAEPLNEDLCKLIEDGTISSADTSTSLARRLVNEYQWDSKDARKIWSFGCPPDATANLLVNKIKGLQLNDIKEHVVSAFNNITAAGALCEEMLRGVRMNIDDVTLHNDAMHRGFGQIIPCARNVFYACQVASSPRIMEPVYKVSITVPHNAQPGVYVTLNKRRGKVLKIKERSGTPYIKIQASLPVAESFGFAQELRKITSGRAFPRMKFSHWQVVGGDPHEDGSSANKIVLGIRKRKGLKEIVPEFGHFENRW